MLFLDEFSEFKPYALEFLRQPLEEGILTIVRTNATLPFAAKFSLLASMNPCKCSHRGDVRVECRCSAHAVEQYRQRISGSLLDRIDLHVDMPALRLEELRGATGESSRPSPRGAEARVHQRRRFAASCATSTNSVLDSE